MITVSGPVQGSGGGGGSQLWKLIGGGNDNIELNTAAFASGIQAILPGDPRYILALAILGSPFAGLLFNDTTAKYSANISIQNLGGVAPAQATIQLDNHTTGAHTDLIVDELTISSVANDNAGNSTGTNNNSLSWYIEHNGSETFKIRTTGLIGIAPGQVVSGAPGTVNAYIQIYDATTNTSLCKIPVVT